MKQHFSIKPPIVLHFAKHFEFFVSPFDSLLVHSLLNLLQSLKHFQFYTSSSNKSKFHELFFTEKPSMKHRQSRTVDQES